MCYLAHHPRHAVEDEAGKAAPPGAPQVRPRWAGAAVTATVAAVALAAFLSPAPPPAAADEPPASAGLQATPVNDAITPVADRQSLPADDGVPGAPELLSAGKRECSHGF